MSTIHALGLIFIVASTLLLPGCKTKTTVTSACGDGFLDPGEECDGIGDLTCADLGFHDPAAVPVCTSDCKLITSGCGPRCGDSTIDAEHGEVCDTDQFAGQTCTSLGYHGGTLACSADCTEYDLAPCEATGRCGDGAIQGEWGEVCDGTELGGATCESNGYHGGTLGCLLSCLGFDESACSLTGRCGDGVIQTETGEVCDGTNLDGETCLTQGFYGGTLTCLADCSAFSTDVCASVGRCGDGAIQTSFGEECDLTDLDGESCQTLGYLTGELLCSSGCTFDEGMCLNIGVISSGNYHTCLIMTDGGMWCWGRGDAGQLGNGGNLVTNLAPVPVTGFTATDPQVSVLSAGGFHTCALRVDGTLWCWGAGGAGQLGNNNTASQQTPVQVVTAGTFTAVDTGGNFTCGIKSDGSVWCWGDNSYGQLGNNNTTNSAAPVQAQGLTSGYTVISAGDYHTCAVKSDHTVRCWGRNTNGQLGNNTTTSSSVPVQVSGMSVAVSVTAGISHTCSVSTSGTANCWGANNYGQVGDGSNTQRLTPAFVSGLGNGTAAISTNGEHTCALRTNGSVMCWGLNNGGYLGNGTITSSNIPVQVIGMETGVMAISNSYNHNCALKNNGFAYCWGVNAYGQLGDGSTATSNIPRQVNPPTP